MKKIAFLALAATLCLTLAACSDSGGVTPENLNHPQSADTTQVVTPPLTAETTQVVTPPLTAETTVITEPSPTIALITSRPEVVFTNPTEFNNAQIEATAPISREMPPTATWATHVAPSECLANNVMCCGSGYWGSMGHDGPLWSRFCSIDFAKRYAQDNPERGGFILANLIMPQAHLPGFEFVNITFSGPWNFEWVATDWKCSRSGSIASYTVHMFESAGMAQSDLARFTENSERFGEINRNVVYRSEFQCSTTNEPRQNFRFIKNENQVANVVFPHVVGMATHDVTKFLEMRTAR